MASQAPRPTRREALSRELARIFPSPPRAPITTHPGRATGVAPASPIPLQEEGSPGVHHRRAPDRRGSRAQSAVLVEGRLFGRALDRSHPTHCPQDLSHPPGVATIQRGRRHRVRRTTDPRPPRRALHARPLSRPPPTNAKRIVCTCPNPRLPGARGVFAGGRARLRGGWQPGRRGVGPVRQRDGPRERAAGLRPIRPDGPRDPAAAGPGGSGLLGQENRREWEGAGDRTPRGTRARAVFAGPRSGGPRGQAGARRGTLGGAA